MLLVWGKEDSKAFISACEKFKYLEVLVSMASQSTETKGIKETQNKKKNPV